MTHDRKKAAVFGFGLVVFSIVFGLLHGISAQEAPAEITTTTTKTTHTITTTTTTITTTTVTTTTVVTVTKPLSVVTIPPVREPDLVLPATPSTKHYYVSISGNDSNDGLSKATPKRTIAAGKALLGNGGDKRLLLKRGDVWAEAFGTWKQKSGASATAPLVVGAYGTGPRPLLLCGSNRGITVQGSRETLKHTVFTDLDFYAHTRDPGNAAYAGNAGDVGMWWILGAENIVWQRCSFRFFATGAAVVQINSDDNSVSGRFVFKDCDFTNSYSSSAHSSGFYLEVDQDQPFVGPIVFDGCVFSHNGWNLQANPAAPQTIFNHGLYIQTSPAAASVPGAFQLVRCVFTRNSSHGVQMRSGGTVRDSFFHENAIAILIGGGDKPIQGGVAATVKDNVIVEGTNIASAPRGWGITVNGPPKACVVSGNRVANVQDAGRENWAIQRQQNTTYSGNVVYRWVANPPHSDEQATNATGLRDPSRSLATFSTSKGGPGTEAAALSRILSRDQGYGVLDLLNYYRAGLSP